MIGNGLVVLEPVAGQVNNIAEVEGVAKDGGSNGSVAKEVGSLVKTLARGNDQERSLAHGKDEAKEEIGLDWREGMKLTSSTSTRAVLWKYLRRHLLALKISAVLRMVMRLFRVSKATE